MLIDKIKVLVRLVILGLLVFVLFKVPVVKREVAKFTSTIESAIHSSSKEISALEIRIAELERRTDTSDKLSIEQDARLTVLTNRVYDLENPKRKPIWRR